MHYCKDSMFGPYWSITRFADIMEIEKKEDFSSDLGLLTDRPEDFSTPNFIGMTAKARSVTADGTGRGCANEPKKNGVPDSAARVEHS